MRPAAADPSPPPPEGGRQAARRGTLAAVAFGARALQQIATLAMTLLAARFLLPSEYGIYTLSVVFITLIQTLTYTGFFHFVLTTRDPGGTLLDTTFWLIVGLGTAGAGLLALLSEAIAALYRAPEMAMALVLLAAIQPVAAATAWASAVLMREQRMRLHFSILIAQNTVALVGGIALLVAWKSVFALVAFRYLRVLSGAVLYAVALRRRPRLRFDLPLARQATLYSAGLYGSRLLTFLSSYGADLVLGMMFSTAEAGLYRFGNRIATGAIDIVAQPLRSFALAQFGAAGRSGAAFGPVLERFAGVTVFATGCVVAVILVFSEAVVLNYFQPAYAEGLVVTYALAAFGFLSIGNLMVEPVLAARHRTGAIMLHHAAWSAVAVTAVLAAAPFGLGALAWSLAAVAAAASAGGLIVIRRLGTTPVSGALAAAGRATAMAALFGTATWLAWEVVRGQLGPYDTGLVAGLGLTTLLAIPAIGLAIRARAFDLRAFSG